MQHIWVTLPPTPNYSKRLPSQTPMTKRAWSSILLPASRLGSQGAGLRPGQSEWELPGGGRLPDTSRALRVHFIHALFLSPHSMQRLFSQVQQGPATSRGREAPGLAPGCELAGGAALFAMVPYTRAQPSCVFSLPRADLYPAPLCKVTFWLKILFHFLKQRSGQLSHLSLLQWAVKKMRFFSGLHYPPVQG